MIDPGPGPAFVGRYQPAADRKGGFTQDDAPVDQRELGGAAADVDVKHALAAVLRQLDRARAVRREPALQPVAGGGAHELPRLGGEQLVDRARVPSLDRLAGEDHRAGIDLAALEPGR